MLNTDPGSGTGLSGWVSRTDGQKNLPGGKRERLGICLEATQALSFCLDGVLTCGGWEILMETGKGIKPQSQHATRTGPGSTEMRKTWLLPLLRGHSHRRPYGVLVILHLTLRNHYLLFCSLLGAWQNWSIIYSTIKWCYNYWFNTILGLLQKTRKEQNVFIQSFTATHKLTISSALYFYLWIQDTVWGHFLLAERTSFGISWK